MNIFCHVIFLSSVWINRKRLDIDIRFLLSHFPHFRQDARRAKVPYLIYLHSAAVLVQNPLQPELTFHRQFQFDSDLFVIWEYQHAISNMISPGSPVFHFFMFKLPFTDPRCFWILFC